MDIASNASEEPAERALSVFLARLAAPLQAELQRGLAGMEGRMTAAADAAHRETRERLVALESRLAALEERAPAGGPPDTLEASIERMETRFSAVEDGLERVKAQIARRLAASARAAAEHVAEQVAARSVDRVPGPLAAALGELDRIARGLGDELDDLATDLRQAGAGSSGSGTERLEALVERLGPVIEAIRPALESEASALAGRIDGAVETLAGHVDTRFAETIDAVRTPAHAARAFRPEEVRFERILIGFRTVLRDLADRVRTFPVQTSPAQMPAGPSPELDARLAAIEARLAALGETMTAAPPANAPTESFSSDRAGLERVLVGFRLLLRQLTREAESLRSVRERLDSVPQPAPAPVAPPVEAAPEPIQPTEVFAPEKLGLERVRTGFQLLLRDLLRDREALGELVTTLRDQIRDLPATAQARPAPAREPGERLTPLVVSQQLTLRSLSAEVDRLTAVVDRIARDPAEATTDAAGLETRLSEALDRFDRTLAPSIAALRDAADSMRAPARPDPADELGGVLGRLADAVGRIDGLAPEVVTAIGRLGEICAKAEGGAVGPSTAAELRDVEERIAAHGAELLAVAAALSQDIEDAAGGPPEESIRIWKAVG